MSGKKHKKRVQPELKHQSASGHIIFCLIIVIVTIGIYINTIHYPFQFDDLHRIRDNRNIRTYYDFRQEYQFFKGERFVVNFTLWLNYVSGSKNPEGIPAVEGMHIFNILTHAANGILVYFLAFMLLGRFFNRNDVKKLDKDNELRGLNLFFNRYTLYLLAMFAGIVFALHPVQTESVTYIITRSELLATFFCLLAIILYIKLVPSKSLISFVIKVVVISILFGFAIESKEWALVLPLLFLLVDYIFLSGGNNKRFIKRINETGSVLLITGIMAVVFVYNLRNTYKGDLDAGFSVEGITHRQYFLSQFNVLIYYFKLMFIPTNLRLDYDFPIMTSIMQFPVFLAIPAVILIIALSIFTFRRSPMLSFMILWFITVIAPSAGVIPIADLIYEHRLYIALAGFAIFAVYFIWRLLQLKGLSKLAYLPYLFLIALTVTYGIGTINRNKVWSSEESLWEDAVAKAPNKARPHMNLGVRYMNMAQEKKDIAYLKKSQNHLERATQLRPDSYDAFHNLGRVYQKMAENKMSTSESLIKSRENFLKASDILLKTIENLDSKIKKQGKYDDILRETLEKQIRFYRKKVSDVFHDLAVSYEHNNSGERYGKGFSLPDAVNAWDKSLEYEPNSEEKIRNKIIAYIYGGDIDNAAGLARKLINSGRSASLPDEFYLSGFTLFRQGKMDDALHFLEAALELAPSHQNAEAARKIIAEIIGHNNN
mgnify:CR=1 FL=1